MSDLREEKIGAMHYQEGLAQTGTISFSIFGIVGALISIHDWIEALPLLIFYGMLIANTHFSIRCFGAITKPRDRSQQSADAALVLLYLLLALSLGNKLIFVAIATLLFQTATIKYILLWKSAGVPSHKRLLEEKLFINALGTLACFFAFGALILGYGAVALWAWALLFLIANIYLLLVNPFYILKE